jgi:predicted PolB exonuclease-like 3'-5' exonuclease
MAVLVGSMFSSTHSHGKAAKMSNVIDREQFFQLLDCKFPKVCFDIETGPERDEVLRQFYDESKVILPDDPGKFDPKTVKIGNLKDPVKIGAKIAEERVKHDDRVRNWKPEVEAIKQQAWTDFINAAPLSSICGRVLAIGYGIATAGGLKVYIDISGEWEMLGYFWDAVVEIRRHGGRLIGHNSNNFDLPFLTRRSWKYGINPPYLFTKYGKPEDFVEDTLRHWGCGDNRAYVKLDHLAKLMGVEGKLEGVTGDQFWVLLRDGQVELARNYLTSDIVATYNVAKGMGLLV